MTSLLLALAIGCSGSTESQLAEIRSLQDAGQYEPSIALLRKILASESGDPEANYRLGIALVQTGRPSLAVWPLQKASQNEAYSVQAAFSWHRRCCRTTRLKRASGPRPGSSKKIRLT